MQKAMIWTGRVLTALPVLLIAFGIIYSQMNHDEVLREFSKFGYPESAFSGIIIVEIACLVLYVIPQTAVLGAILLTGYLGGAVATHVRVSESWVMPVIVGVVVWLGIYFREPKLRALVPLRW